MTETRSAAEIAERHSRRRPRILFLQAVLFTAWQGSFFVLGTGGEGDRLVDHVQTSAWAVWVLALLLMMSTSGGWFRGREVRRLINDEVAIDNRRRGQQFGFYAAVLAGLGVYAFHRFVDPISVPGAVHAILSIGIGAALLRYALLERRAERG